MGHVARIAEERSVEKNVFKNVYLRKKKSLFERPKKDGWAMLKMI
jgi:hypothetical protein